MAQSASLLGPEYSPVEISRSGSRQRWMKMPLPLVDQEFIYPKDWAISVTFLSFLQDRRNRLLLESIVVLSLESHVGSFYRCSGLSIPSAIKKPPKNSPAENRISSEFLDFTD
jgi:hypothetical protein